MTSFVEKAHKADIRAYNTWFNRWNKQFNLSAKVIQAAQQGYTGLTLYSSDDYSYPNNNDYKVRRFEDKRFIQRLEAEYPDIKFERTARTKTNVFGKKRLVRYALAIWEVQDD